MGKRQRRRQRQQKNKTIKQQKQAVQRYLLPSADTPLLEVVFYQEVTDEDKQICLDYWAFTEPGTWTHKVAEIGPTTAVLRTVKASCHADLLTVVCPDCAGPRSVYSRSDVTATRLWFPDVFPAKRPCPRSSARRAGTRRPLSRRGKPSVRRRRSRSASRGRSNPLECGCKSRPTGICPAASPTFSGV
ncbi:hypothetical protein ACFQVA_22825 [Actinomadura keratinilytica]